MVPLSFTKMHGAGNDFVVLDGVRRRVSLSAAQARRLADRRFGAGADQILIVEKPRRREADFRLRILNADGGQVEMCGNGIRCAALFVRAKGLTRKREQVFETPAGLIRPVIKADGSVRVDMGVPVLEAVRVPTRARGRVIERPFQWPGGRGNLTAVSMGNPHAVFFVDSLDKTPVETWGPVLETHRFFPRRTNVEFAQALGPGRVRARVWERGAGLTLACGTGACAVGVAGVLTGRLHRTVDIVLPGGTLGVEWAADNHVYLTGPAAFVYEGVWIFRKS
jgi:diaminopimelate epimerase